MEGPMKNLLASLKLLLSDLASTILFLAVFLLTRNIALAVVLGVALGVTQVGFQLIRRKPIETMEWLSLFLVVASGTAALITNNPRFVMLKPSLIYAIVGIVMLKPGWMNRYLPPMAKALVPDIAVIFGFVWAGLMFVSAALNIFVALHFSVATWASFMSAYGILSKLVLFVVSYATMRTIGRRRFDALPVPERDGLTAAGAG
jgi:intracellular septation protein